MSLQLRINNFGIDCEKKVLLKGNVHQNCHIQTLFLGEQNHILSCISNQHKLKISLLTPQILKLHEFDFKSQNHVQHGNSHHILGKVINSLEAEGDFILKLGLVTGGFLETYRMRFSPEEGTKEFLLEHRMQVPRKVTQICLFSRDLLGMFFQSRELHMIHVRSGRLILKKRIKGERIIPDSLLRIEDLPAFQTKMQSGFQGDIESLKILSLPSMREYVSFLLSKTRFVEALNLLLYFWVGKEGGLRLRTQMTSWSCFSTF